MSKDHDAIQKGVTESWDFWLSQHDVSVPYTIEEAVKAAWTDWLWAHSDQIIERITGPTSAELQALREQARKDGRPW